MKSKKIRKKKNTQKKKGIKKYNHEIVGILLLAAGLIVFSSIFFEDSMGPFGSYVKNIILGFMGAPGFFVSPLIIVYSFFIIFKKNNRDLNLKISYSFILVLLVSALVQTGFYDEGDYHQKGVISSIKDFYVNGRDLAGGGVLGGLISIPFLLMFKELGTIIILTTAGIINVILITNISIAGVIVKIKNGILSLVKKVENKLKLSDKEIKNELIEETDEPDIVMNGERLPKVVDINRGKKKNKKENQKEDGSLEEGEVLEKVDVENKEVDFIVKDIKKSENSSEAVEKIADSVNKEINSKTKTNIDYKYPYLELLDDGSTISSDAVNCRKSALKGAKKLEETLKSFGVDAKVINVSMGPAVTRYELQPSAGVKVSKIVGLSDDICLNLAASGVRMEAPIPGKAAIGIEVPNEKMVPVLLKDVIESREFKEYDSKLAFSLGKDISGQNTVADIAKMPHVLVAGATGSGKSVCINSLIISLLYKSSPNEVKLLMIDPKVVELGIYNGIPHLLIPVVTEPKKAAGALNWAVQEMEERYKLFAQKGVRDIKGYNDVVNTDEGEETLPQVVIIIDELADLMMVAPNDVEDAICRLAQMARAAGMHLVIATQRPSVNVITGVIKANIPSRIAFSVSSQVDSRTIIDMSGAEKLLGKGDMLFYPVGEPKPVRVKGAFVSDKEVERVVEYIKSQGDAEYNEDIIEEINTEREVMDKDSGDSDELLPQAIELVVEAGQASVSMIQRKFKVGYARAARIVDQMEERGIVGGFEGSKPRQVLITKLQLQELEMRNDN
ncbi:DNA translocase FtsK 4TM domain-containing protein [Herbivorax sp. ANBcel31]|uniref:FtsK/SpoIIIE family DNA translocase n=1 Tax=Herbivorax sp. ANBcel31 TaxID=3069754 RepID=UPI0027B2A5DD|nr:DNA translocase FtsK [Herbivorax sp. ANBcel31]MDQ2085957.1 DNA translocase FtsK 4TM domain-containing protein [Herbivorax sp. ANBcel31]